VERESPVELAEQRSRVTRIALMALGWLFFGLGLIGAVLPVMPTTPFLILALWAFSLSSRRFHDWLYHHRLFGPRLQMWNRHRVIPLPVKLAAYGGMLASLSYTALIARLSWTIVVPIAAFMLVGVWFIGRCPSRPPPEPE